MINIEVKGDRQVALRFAEFPKALHERLLGVIESIGRRLEDAVKAEEPVRTGKLRAETGLRIIDKATRISAIVSINAPDGVEAGKAAALEYGAHRPFTMKAHEASLSHLWARAIASIAVEVPAHQRRPNITEHRFLRGPIAAMREEALAELRAAVDQTTAEVAA